MKVEVTVTSFPIISAMKSPSKFRKHLRKNYARAAFIVGRVISAKMRRVIQGGMGPPNAPMTTKMKGSTKPLVDSGRLFKAITHKVGGKYSEEVAIGVMRSHASANVAKIVSKGAQIQVSRRMAALFRVLHAASLGRPAKITSPRGEQLLASSKGEIPVLRVGTTLVIPPRPFAEVVAKDPTTKQMIKATYGKALADTFKDMKGGGPSS